MFFYFTFIFLFISRYCFSYLLQNAVAHFCFYPSSQEAFYDPIEVQVIGDHGESVTCRTYEMIGETTSDCLPSPHYKKVLVEGAKQNELPEEYIEYLDGFPDNGVTDTPPNYRKVMDMVETLNEEDSCESRQWAQNSI